MPERIADTLLVVEGFRASDGTEYRPGDRVQVRKHKIRQVALERPELFRMEYASAPVDLDWLLELDRRHNAEYAETKRINGSAESRRRHALAAEFETQERAKPGQHELARRYEKQKADRQARLEQVRENQEREVLEEQLASMGGFHY